MNNASAHTPQKIFKSAVVKDLIILSIVVLLLFILEFTFGFFEHLDAWLEKGQGSEKNLMEALAGFSILFLALAVFSWRRWREQKTVTAERQRAEEALTKEKEFTAGI